MKRRLLRFLSWSFRPLPLPKWVARASYRPVEIALACVAIAIGAATTPAWRRGSDVPAIVIVTLICLPALAFGLWRARRRFQRRYRQRGGLCVRCGYNLTRSVSDRCPECGTLLPPSRRPVA